MFLTQHSALRTQHWVFRCTTCSKPINYPHELRALDERQLKQLADELRAFLLDSVSQTGGHLSSNLGTVELTIALHYVFDTPHDRIVWDVGHQTYGHKVLTGRREGMDRLRMWGGLSGFPRREESEYDTFGTAHSSTSISAAFGMAVASRLAGVKRHVVAVIGDGAMTAGMAFEALNNAGDSDADLLVILNDNEMSISPPVGALNKYLAKLMSGRFYSAAKRAGEKVLGELAKRAEEHVKGMVTPSTLFEEFGFNYIGPIDGHDLDALIPDAAQHEGAEGAAVPARGDAQGAGLQARRGRPGALPRRLQVRHHQRHRRRQERRQADLHPDFRRLAVRHGGEGPAPGRHHARDARGFRAW